MRKIVLIILFASPLLYSETITIVADQWEPINGTPNSLNPGYVVELAEMIFTDSGFDFEYRLVPWARAVEGVRSGRYSAAIGATKDNSQLLLIPQQPFGILENDFYTSKNNHWIYSGPLTLSDQVLGIISGYSYGEIQEYIDLNCESERIHISYGETALERNLRMLLWGRITVLVEWGPVADYMISEMGWQDVIRHAGRGGNATPLYLGFSPERNDLTDLWDLGFLKAMEDGNLDRILDKYGLDKLDIGFN